MENTARLVSSLSPRIMEGSDDASSGVSWGAVIGGAFVAAAISLILLALGAGFGLPEVSPWSNSGGSGAAVGTAAIVWLIAIQLISYGMGGYLTGRLRTKWAAIHNDEVYFRDTANGFLVWAVGLVMIVTFLVSSATYMAGSAVQASPTSDGAYFVDQLLRSDGVHAADASLQQEVGRILTNALYKKDLSQADDAYLARLIAVRTGLAPADAQSRVTQIVSDARQAQDSARQAVARLLLWTFLALLIGAFSSSFAATIGGRQRDHVKVI